MTPRQQTTAELLAIPTEQQLALMSELVTANQSLSIQHLVHRLGPLHNGGSKSTLVMSLIAKAVQEGKCEVITAASLGVDWIEVDGNLLPYVIRWKKNCNPGRQDVQHPE